MSCNCCNNVTRVRASTIAVADGVTTITIPSGTTLVSGQVYDIGLFTSIPALTDGNIISITNGSVTGNLFNKLANYARIPGLRSRMVLRVLYLDDPAHFLLLAVRR